MQHTDRYEYQSYDPSKYKENYQKVHLLYYLWVGTYCGDRYIYPETEKMSVFTARLRSGAGM